ncbi:MAG: hypothetical protein ACTSRG_27160, partial [Candidatus Helarchaeota archaeon]
LNQMLFSIKELNTNFGSVGGKTLSQILNPDFKLLDSQNEIQNFDIHKIKDVLSKYHLEKEYNKLSINQQNIIGKIFKKLVISIKGEGGTGKTEVGSLIAIIFALIGYKVIISSETNKAVNNILERINKHLSSSSSANDRLNIIRFRARNQQLENEDLRKYELNDVISRHQSEIERKCLNIPQNDPNYRLKKEFNDLFTRSEILEDLISLTYDISLVTYGTMSERKFFSMPIQKYDLNIIESSSSINLSVFSIAAHNSKKWLMLYDPDQLAPSTIGDYLLKQPLRFPNEIEQQNAKKYQPKNLDFKNALLIKGTKEFRNSIASTIERFNKNPKISIIELKKQFRIHPKLYKRICYATDREYTPQDTDPSSYLDLSEISPLFDSENHFKYQIADDMETLSNMGIHIAKIVENLERNTSKLNEKITIGVACTDVYSLRKVVDVYKNTRTHNQLSLIRNNYYDEENEVFKITFSSIKSHQEGEYDIFIFGIINFSSIFFKKIIYTALTRASNYAIVFGPEIRYISKNKGKNRENKRILRRLQEEKC